MLSIEHSFSELSGLQADDVLFVIVTSQFLVAYLCSVSFMLLKDSASLANVQSLGSLYILPFKLLLAVVGFIPGQCCNVDIDMRAVYVL